MHNLLFSDEKTGVYISSYQLFHLLRSYGRVEGGFENARFDFKKFREMLRENSRMVHSNFYFNPLPAGNPDPGRPLADKLGYMGWKIVGREQIVHDSDGQSYSYNRDALVDMAVDIVRDSQRLDHIIIMTSDSNILPAIEEAQRNCCRVTVISDKKTPVGKISLLSCGGCNDFVEFSTLTDYIISTPKMETRR